jgi:uncharacterized membrane protein YraQ (UPF0718 family)
MADLIRGLLALALAALLYAQGRGAPPLRRRAFTLAAPGIALLGFSTVSLNMGLPYPLAYTLTGLGLALILAGLFFLIRSWQSGELRELVQRYQAEAAQERERREQLASDKRDRTE